MSVWVLVAVMQLHEVVGGHLEAFVGVFATETACERERAEMQRVNKDNVWKCLREEPKQ